MFQNQSEQRQGKLALDTLLPILTFVKPYKVTVAAALLALVVTAAVTLAIGQGVKMVIDNGFIAGSKEQLGEAIIVLVIMICLLAFGTFSRFYLMSWLGERVCADIRKAVFERLMGLHPSYFEENRSGEIMSRLTTDTTLLQSIIGSSFSMALRSGLMFLGALLMLVFTNLKLTLVVMGCVPFILLPMLFYGRKVRRLARKSQDRIADVGTYAGEIIRNIKVVQSYTREGYETAAFGHEVESAFAVARERIRQRSVLVAIVIFLVFGAICAMLWIGGMDVLAGNITEGELAAFVFYAIMVAMSLATISEVYGELQRASGAAERLCELLAVKSEIQAPLQPARLDDQADTLVSFERVDFCYPSRPGSPALIDINLTIRMGQVVALVGPSGAGKTTIFELLQRFYDPQSGEIRFKGAAISQLEPALLRRQMAMVQQQPVMFSSDVWHNIRYGRPEASDEEVIWAAKRAHAHDFIMALPKGYDSFLGEQGVRLSGGQKQRVALARAILKDPEVLLLDEATSALDAESEFYVQAALNELMVGRTTLIIAHRLSTVVHADMIVLLDQGRIVARGTHAQLLAKSGLYRRLCELQFDGAEEARSVPADDIK